MGVANIVNLRDILLAFRIIESHCCAHQSNRGSWPRRQSAVPYHFRARDGNINPRIDPALRIFSCLACERVGHRRRDPANRLRQRLSFSPIIVHAFEAFRKSAVTCWGQQTSEQPGGQRAGRKGQVRTG